MKTYAEQLTNELIILLVNFIESQRVANGRCYFRIKCENEIYFYDEIFRWEMFSHDFLHFVLFSSRWIIEMRLLLFCFLVDSVINISQFWGKNWFLRWWAMWNFTSNVIFTLRFDQKPFCQQTCCIREKWLRRKVHHRVKSKWDIVKTFLFFFFQMTKRKKEKSRTMNSTET